MSIKYALALYLASIVLWNTIFLVQIIFGLDTIEVGSLGWWVAVVAVGIGAVKLAPYLNLPEENLAKLAPCCNKPEANKDS